jgi:hypothetical protein
MAAVAILVSVVPGQAHITRLVVEHTESLGPDGAERLTGHVYGEVDPQLPLNAIITDLAFAPRNERGMVEYVSTFTIVKPADMAKASGVLLWVASNRGRMNLTADGFLADARTRGHVLVTSGWQGDLEPADGRETMSVPVARHADGTSITGRVLARFSEMPLGTSTLPIRRGGVTGTADPASLDSLKGLLTRRRAERSATVPLRSTDWAFADCTSRPFPGTPDPRKLCLKEGFDPAFLYELVYTAKDPKVYGLGFAATRDLTSFLRHGAQDDAGTPNPLHGRISWVISQGNSQAGTFLRSFIHLGFNQDEAGLLGHLSNLVPGAGTRVDGLADPGVARRVIRGSLIGWW